jgi:hypothetical protein
MNVISKNKKKKKKRVIQYDFQGETLLYFLDWGLGQNGPIASLCNGSENKYHISYLIKINCIQ